MKTLVIQGSARSKGNTRKIVETFRRIHSSDFIDLKAYFINHYDYDHTYDDDDFIGILKKILRYDLIVLASPIYWYTMSGRMKVFLDRLTDCLTIHKNWGYQLKGKHVAVISCGSDSAEVTGFFNPFKNTADYLGMKYAGGIHTWINSDSIDPATMEIITSFSKYLKS